MLEDCDSVKEAPETGRSGLLVLGEKFALPLGLVGAVVLAAVFGWHDWEPREFRPPPPRPVVGGEDFFLRHGITDEGTTPAAEAREPAFDPSFKPSREGFYGYGEAGGKLMWEDP